MQKPKMIPVESAIAVMDNWIKDHPNTWVGWLATPEELRQKLRANGTDGKISYHDAVRIFQTAQSAKLIPPHPKLGYFQEKWRQMYTS